MRACAVLLLLVLAARLGAEEPLELSNTLPLAGPRVAVRLPLGREYRPGAAVPLEVWITHNGPACNADLTVFERHTHGLGPADCGIAVTGPRYGAVRNIPLPPFTQRRVVLPVRLPPVSAASAFVELRDVQAGTLIFKGSLGGVVRPRPPEPPVMLFVRANTGAAGGPGGSAFAAHWLGDAAQLAADELPLEAWMYESVDIVVLQDDALLRAPTEALRHLRLWLLGGGRLFIARPGALPAARAAGLLPDDSVPAQPLVLPGETAGSPQAGLFTAQPLGFGRVVRPDPERFALLPEARPLAAQALLHPQLQRPREARPDMRVQPERSAAFSYGAVSPGRRVQAGHWALGGAAILLAGLLYARSQRNALLAAGWALAVAALLGVLMARAFPPLDGARSQIRWQRFSADGRAQLSETWLLLERARTRFSVDAAGSADGSLLPIADTPAELATQSYTQDNAGGRLLLSGLAVAPGAPLLLHASRFTESTPPPGPRRFHSSQPPAAFSVRGSLAGSAFAVWVRADGSLWLAEFSTTGKAGEQVQLTPFTGWPSTVARTNAGLPAAAQRTLASALGWASKEALRSGESTLLEWSDSAVDGGAPAGIPADEDADVELDSGPARAEWDRARSITVRSWRVAE